jgi:YggT family protein
MYQILNVIIWLLQIYQFILLARVLLTWLPNVDYNNPIVQFLYQVTEPVLAPIRKALPPMNGMDLSPLAVYFGIFLVMRILPAMF